MSEFDLVVRGGTVVTHDRSTTADIGVIDGRVAAVAPGLAAGRVEVDATSLHVLPGLVDVHVHMRDPGWPQKGDFSDGTRAAALGGVTTVVDMPNTNPPVVDADGLIAKRQRLAPKAHVDFGLYGLFGAKNSDAFAEMANAGAMGLKLYMARSVVELPIPADDEIVAGLEAAADAGLVVGVHAENERIVRLFSERMLAAGRSDPRSHSCARPPLAELEAVTRIVTLADALGAELHIHHLSSRAALERFQLLAAGNPAITAEAIVGHLLLDDRDYKRAGNLIKLNPPVRNASDVEALWRGIADGTISLVATDHAPHTDAEQAEADVWRALGGFSGVETLLPVMLAAGSDRGLALTDIVRLCAYEPARRWRIAGKGTLAPGADADMVLLDLEAPASIDPAALSPTSRATPFAQMMAPGTIRGTFLRGQLIARDGTVIGEPAGRFVRPRHV